MTPKLKSTDLTERQRREIVELYRLKGSGSKAARAFNEKHATSIGPDLVFKVLRDAEQAVNAPRRKRDAEPTP